MPFSRTAPPAAAAADTEKTADRTDTVGSSCSISGERDVPSKAEEWEQRAVQPSTSRHYSDNTTGINAAQVVASDPNFFSTGERSVPRESERQHEEGDTTAGLAPMTPTTVVPSVASISVAPARPLPAFARRSSSPHGPLEVDTSGRGSVRSNDDSFCSAQHTLDNTHNHNDASSSAAFSSVNLRGMGHASSFSTSNAGNTINVHNCSMSVSNHTAATTSRAQHNSSISHHNNEARHSSSCGGGGGMDHCRHAHAHAHAHAQHHRRRHGSEGCNERYCSRHRSSHHHNTNHNNVSLRSTRSLANLSVAAEALSIEREREREREREGSVYSLASHGMATGRARGLSASTRPRSPATAGLLHGALLSLMQDDAEEMPQLEGPMTAAGFSQVSRLGDSLQWRPQEVQQYLHDGLADSSSAAISNAGVLEHSGALPRHGSLYSIPSPHSNQQPAALAAPQSSQPFVSQHHTGSNDWGNASTPRHGGGSHRLSLSQNPFQTFYPAALGGVGGSSAEDAGIRRDASLCSQQFVFPPGVGPSGADSGVDDFFYPAGYRGSVSPTPSLMPMSHLHTRRIPPPPTDLTRVNGSGRRCRQTHRRVCDMPVETTNVARLTSVIDKGQRYTILNGRYVLYDRVLGAGSYSKVVLAHDLRSRIYYAAKVLDRSKMLRAGLASDGVVSLEREIFIMRQLRHKNIIALHEVVNDPACRKVYLLFELAECGEAMSMRDDGTVVPFSDGLSCFSEHEVVRIVRGVLVALMYTHHLGIAHRDVKPQNVLLTGEGTVKLSDYGSAMLVSGDEVEKARREGSIAFMAPELLCSAENLAARWTPTHSSLEVGTVTAHNSSSATNAAVAAAAAAAMGTAASGSLTRNSGENILGCQGNNNINTNANANANNNNNSMLRSVGVSSVGTPSADADAGISGGVSGGRGTDGDGGACADEREFSSRYDALSGGESGRNSVRRSCAGPPGVAAGGSGLDANAPLAGAGNAGTTDSGASFSDQRDPSPSYSRGASPAEAGVSVRQQPFGLQSGSGLHGTPLNEDTLSLYNRTRNSDSANNNQNNTNINNNNNVNNSSDAASPGAGAGGAWMTSSTAAAGRLEGGAGSPSMLLSYTSTRSMASAGAQSQAYNQYMAWARGSARPLEVNLFKADVFALGVTAFTLLLGRLPWRISERGASSQLNAILSAPDPFLSLLQSQHGVSYRQPASAQDPLAFTSPWRFVRSLNNTMNVSPSGTVVSNTSFGFNYPNYTPGTSLYHPGSASASTGQQQQQQEPESHPYSQSPRSATGGNARSPSNNAANVSNVATAGGAFGSSFSTGFGSSMSQSQSQSGRPGAMYPAAATPFSISAANSQLHGGGGGGHSVAVAAPAALRGASSPVVLTSPSGSVALRSTDVSAASAGTGSLLDTTGSAPRMKRQTLPHLQLQTFSGYQDESQQQPQQQQQQQQQQQGPHGNLDSPRLSLPPSPSSAAYRHSKTGPGSGASGESSSAAATALVSPSLQARLAQWSVQRASKPSSPGTSLRPSSAASAMWASGVAAASSQEVSAVGGNGGPLSSFGGGSSPYHSPERSVERPLTPGGESSGTDRVTVTAQPSGSEATAASRPAAPPPFAAVPAPKNIAVPVLSASVMVGMRESVPLPRNRLRDSEDTEDEPFKFTISVWEKVNGEPSTESADRDSELPQQQEQQQQQPSDVELGNRDGDCSTISGGRASGLWPSVLPDDEKEEEGEEDEGSAVGKAESLNSPPIPPSGRRLSGTQNPRTETDLILPAPNSSSTISADAHTSDGAGAVHSAEPGHATTHSEAEKEAEAEADATAAAPAEDGGSVHEDDDDDDDDPVTPLLTPTNSEDCPLGIRPTATAIAPGTATAGAIGSSSVAAPTVRQSVYDYSHNSYTHKPVSDAGSSLRPVNSCTMPNLETGTFSAGRHRAAAAHHVDSAALSQNSMMSASLLSRQRGPFRLSSPVGGASAPFPGSGQGDPSTNSFDTNSNSNSKRPGETSSAAVADATNATSATAADLLSPTSAVPPAPSSATLSSMSPFSPTDTANPEESSVALRSRVPIPPALSVIRVSLGVDKKPNASAVQQPPAASAGSPNKPRAPGVGIAAVAVNTSAPVTFSAPPQLRGLHSPLSASVESRKLLAGSTSRSGAGESSVASCIVPQAVATSDDAGRTTTSVGHVGREGLPRRVPDDASEANASSQRSQASRPHQPHLSAPRSSRLPSACDSSRRSSGTTTQNQPASHINRSADESGAARKCSTVLDMGDLASAAEGSPLLGTLGSRLHERSRQNSGELGEDEERGLPAFRWAGGAGGDGDGAAAAPGEEDAGDSAEMETSDSAEDEILLQEILRDKMVRPLPESESHPIKAVEGQHGEISADAIDFIRHCLCIDFSQRRSVFELYEHPWIQKLLLEEAEAAANKSASNGDDAEDPSDMSHLGSDYGRRNSGNRGGRGAHSVGISKVDLSRDDDGDENANSMEDTYSEGRSICGGADRGSLFASPVSYFTPPVPAGTPTAAATATAAGGGGGRLGARCGIRHLDIDAMQSFPANNNNSSAEYSCQSAVSAVAAGLPTTDTPTADDRLRACSDAMGLPQALPASASVAAWGSGTDSNGANNNPTSNNNNNNTMSGTDFNSLSDVAAAAATLPASASVAYDGTVAGSSSGAGVGGGGAEQLCQVDSVALTNGETLTGGGRTVSLLGYLSSVNAGGPAGLNSLWQPSVDHGHGDGDGDGDGCGSREGSDSASAPRSAPNDSARTEQEQRQCHLRGSGDDSSGRNPDVTTSAVTVGTSGLVDGGPPAVMNLGKGISESTSNILANYINNIITHQRYNQSDDSSDDDHDEEFEEEDQADSHASRRHHRRHRGIVRSRANSYALSDRGTTPLSPGGVGDGGRRTSTSYASGTGVGASSSGERARFRDPHSSGRVSHLFHSHSRSSSSRHLQAARQHSSSRHHVSEGVLYSHGSWSSSSGFGETGNGDGTRGGGHADSGGGSLHPNLSQSHIDELDATATPTSNANLGGTQVMESSVVTDGTVNSLTGRRQPPAAVARHLQHHPQMQQQQRQGWQPSQLRASVDTQGPPPHRPRRGSLPTAAASPVTACSSGPGVGSDCTFPLMMTGSTVAETTSAAGPAAVAAAALSTSTHATASAAENEASASADSAILRRSHSRHHGSDGGSVTRPHSSHSLHGASLTSAHATEAAELLLAGGSPTQRLPAPHIHSGNASGVFSPTERGGGGGRDADWDAEGDGSGPLSDTHIFCSASQRGAAPPSASVTSADAPLDATVAAATAAAAAEEELSSVNRRPRADTTATLLPLRPAASAAGSATVDDEEEMTMSNTFPPPSPETVPYLTGQQQRHADPADMGATADGK